jgi:aerobic carbon-monoxide dehydrogenase medium subunit
VIPVEFEYLAPSSLDEASSMLMEYGDEAKLLAGGQSLLPMMKLRIVTPSHLIDLSQVPGLVSIERDGSNGTSGRIMIGAMTPYYQLQASPLLRQACSLLAETTAVVADVQVRNQGTIGGSLAHADPTGDMPAAILALDADLKVVGPVGERWIPVSEFFDGAYSTALIHGEILTEVRVPALEGWTSAYRKMAPHASGFAIAGVAVCLRQGPDHTCEEIRIGVTGVSDQPYRAYSVEDALRGRVLEPRVIEEATASIAEGLWVSDDLRAAPEYRAHVAQVYATRAILAARDAAPTA